MAGKYPKLLDSSRLSVTRLAVETRDSRVSHVFSEFGPWCVQMSWQDGRLLNQDETVSEVVGLLQPLFLRQHQELGFVHRWNAVDREEGISHFLGVH